MYNEIMFLHQGIFHGKVVINKLGSQKENKFSCVAKIYLKGQYDKNIRICLKLL